MASYRPKKGSKGIYKSKESLNKIKELGFILLEDPAYSPVRRVFLFNKKLI